MDYNDDEPEDANDPIKKIQQILKVREDLIIDQVKTLAVYIDENNTYSKELDNALVQVINTISIVSKDIGAIVSVVKHIEEYLVKKDPLYEIVIKDKPVRKPKTKKPVTRGRPKKKK